MRTLPTADQVEERVIKVRRASAEDFPYGEFNISDIENDLVQARILALRKVAREMVYAAERMWDAHFTVKGPYCATYAAAYREKSNSLGDAATDLIKEIHCLKTLPEEQAREFLNRESADEKQECISEAYDTDPRADIKIIATRRNLSREVVEAREKMLAKPTTIDTGHGNTDWRSRARDCRDLQAGRSSA